MTNLLKIACLEKGVYMYQLADAIGISESTLSKVSSGRRRLSPSQARLAAEYLGRTPEELGLEV